MMPPLAKHDCWGIQISLPKQETNEEEEKLNELELLLLRLLLLLLFPSSGESTSLSN
jgi:hypothetical protein